MTGGDPTAPGVGSLRLAGNGGGMYGGGAACRETVCCPSRRQVPIPSHSAVYRFFGAPRNLEPPSYRGALDVSNAYSARSRCQARLILCPQLLRVPCERCLHFRQPLLCVRVCPVPSGHVQRERRPKFIVLGQINRDVCRQRQRSPELQYQRHSVRQLHLAPQPTSIEPATLTTTEVKYAQHLAAFGWL